MSSSSATSRTSPAGRPCAFPQLGSVALQAGQWTAKNIVADVDGNAMEPFEYHDKGIMAMIGHNAAIAEMGEHRHELHGAVGYAAWIGVHAYLMSGVSTSGPTRSSTGRGTSSTSAASSTPPTRHGCTGKGTRMSESYDVIIIGTGAGGGTLANTLAPSGKKILLLERGDFLPRERENWDPGEVFINGRYISKDTWYTANGEAFQPQVHYFVGGATKMYGAALYRLRPQDFGELKHVDGVSPAWPLSYDDFEPYYTKAEWLFQVHGNHGEDPIEGHWSKQYPWPAVSHEPRIQELSDNLASAGYSPFHAPCGILLDEADRPRSTCIRCTWCDGYPCLVHAKSDAETMAVRPVLDMPNVTLKVHSRVVKLETDPSGRTVTGVVVDHDGEQVTYTADIVSVSAGAANSAQILLASATDTHPNGLANGSDQVGRNYMFHNSKAMVALAKEPNDTTFQKTLGVNDFYFGTDGYD